MHLTIMLQVITTVMDTHTVIHMDTLTGTHMDTHIQVITIHIQVITTAILTLVLTLLIPCLLYTSPSPRDRQKSRMPSSA